MSNDKISLRDIIKISPKDQKSLRDIIENKSDEPNYVQKTTPSNNEIDWTEAAKTPESWKEALTQDDNKHFKEMLKKMEENPNDWKTLMDLAEYYEQKGEDLEGTKGSIAFFDQSISCWESVAKILGDKFGIKRSYGNRKKFAWAYLRKARHLLDILDSKSREGKKLSAESEEVLLIQELYSKASKLYTDAYNGKDANNIYVMVDEVPTYKVILKDLSHLKSVTSVGFNVTEAEEAVAKAKKRLVGRLVIHTNVQEVKQLELFSQELETCSPNRRKTLTHAQHVVKKQLDKRKTELELIKKAEKNHETDEKTSD